MVRSYFTTPAGHRPTPATCFPPPPPPIDLPSPWRFKGIVYAHLNATLNVEQSFAGFANASWSAMSWVRVIKTSNSIQLFAPFFGPDLSSVAAKVTYTDLGEYIFELTHEIVGSIYHPIAGPIPIPTNFPLTGYEDRSIPDNTVDIWLMEYHELPQYGAAASLITEVTLTSTKPPRTRRSVGTT